MLRIPYRALLTAFLSSALLAGCASTGSHDADKPTLAEFDANLNQGVVLARILGLDKKKEAAAEENQASAGDAAAAAPSVLATKLGLVLAGPVDAELAAGLDQALAAAQAEYPLVVISSAEMTRQLEAYGCQPERPEACAAQLASYPGVQQLLMISQQNAAAGKTAVTLQLLETAPQLKQPPQTIELVDSDAASPQAALDRLAKTIITDALSAARATPWATRAFKQEGSDIFLAAGKRSGLQPGMELTVHSPGRAITSPTGSLAGWIPGAPKGVIKITALFGEDYAIAELLQGAAPTPADPLLLRE